MITIPQVKSTGLICIAIIFVSACLAVSNAFIHGEIHKWGDLLKEASDSLLYAVGIGIGWIALKSPLSKEVTSLLTQESSKVTELPSGGKVTEQVKTSVQVEVAPPDPPKPTT